MSLQNIKSTGLDFVYRGVGLETVCRVLRDLRAPAVECGTWSHGKRAAPKADAWGVDSRQHHVANAAPAFVPKSAGRETRRVPNRH